MESNWKSIGSKLELNDTVLVDGELQTITGIHIDMMDTIMGSRTDKQEFVPLIKIAHG